MRGGDEHDHGGHHGVHAQSDQAEPVDHHRRELPVRDNNLLLILLSHPLCQESERDIRRLEIFMFRWQILPEFPVDEFDLLGQVHVDTEGPPGGGAAVEGGRGQGGVAAVAVLAAVGGAGPIILHRGEAQLCA